MFHVHIDASNFAIGAILAQPGEKNMDFPFPMQVVNSTALKRTTQQLREKDLA